MFNLIKDILSVISIAHKKQLYILQLLVILSAIFEVISVLTIGPFMALVGDSSLVETHSLINMLYEYVGSKNPQEFLIFFGVLTLTFLFIAAIFSILTIWRLSLFAADVGAEFGDKLYKYYMTRSYLYHTSTNSSMLIKQIATEVNRVTDNILQPMVQINARLATVIFISVMIFLYQPLVAIIGLVLFSCSYYVMYILVRSKLSKNGQLISDYSKKRFLLMNEGFGAIKEIQILGRVSYFIESFRESGQIFAHAYGTSNGLYNMPRYFMEFIVYSGMIGLVLVLLNSNDGQFSAVLPILGVFGIAAFKLLPSFQQVYSGAAQIRSNLSAFDAIKNDLLASRASIYKATPQSRKTSLSGNLILNNANFCYPNQSQNTLKDISLHIPFRSTIGIVGPSGSGKSTLLDALIGVIQLNSGVLTIGGEIINGESLSKWHNSIGYVSQTSLLKEGSIAENIAFGIPDSQVDYKKILCAADMAHLIEWTDSLPDGLNTSVGERGLQISGGQRQRIAIARALYNDAEYLFFDEATSALDGITEKNIMESIDSISKLKTIIMIAHRLNTVKNCDHIYMINKGEIIDHGSYDELMASNAEFKVMAEGV